MKQSDKLVPLAACAVITAWVAFTTTAIANEDTTNLTMPFEDSAPETSNTETSTIGRSANVESKLSAEFAEFGPFYVGLQMSSADLSRYLEGRGLA